VAKKSRMSVLKRQREAKKAEKAALKRERKEQRDGDTDPANEGGQVATREDLAGYGFEGHEETGRRG
jgi:hypothetical protein